MRVICLVFCCLLFHFSRSDEGEIPAVVTAHDHGEEDSFHHLTEILGAALEGIVNETDFVKLVNGLKARITCNASCSACLEMPTIKTLLGNASNTTLVLEEDNFPPAAELVVEIFLRGHCEGIDKTNHDISFNISSEKETDLLLEQIKGIYEHEHTAAACFNSHVIFHDIHEESDVIVRLVTNLYEGLCILPTEDEMTEELFEHIGVEGDAVSDAVFSKLLSELGIGQPGIIVQPTEDPHAGHNHKRKRRATHEGHEHDEEMMCYTGDQLKNIYAVEGNLSRSTLLKMCPALVQQIISGSCNGTTSIPTAAPPTFESWYSDARKYGYGTASVLLISLLAFAGLLFFPILNSESFKMVMQFFIALGVGTLSGDAILHIIPEILGLHNHSEDEHDHSNEDLTYAWKLLVVIGGIWVFFLFENFIKVLVRKRAKGSEHIRKVVEAHHHGPMSTSQEDGQRHSHFHHHVNGTREKEPSSEEITKKQLEAETGEGEKKARLCFGINTVCMMVLIGDVLHNFGDGIAIGAAFSSSWITGIGTSLAIFCHELPHEFGDFAIYLKNGLSKGKALLLNFGAACCAFIGMFIGVAISTDQEARQWLLALVAGMFLYIAFVNVLHEMVEDETKYPVTQFLVQNIGLILGWLILFLLSIYEEELVNSIA